MGPSVKTLDFLNPYFCVPGSQKEGLKGIKKMVQTLNAWMSAAAIPKQLSHDGGPLATKCPVFIHLLVILKFVFFT